MSKKRYNLQRKTGFPRILLSAGAVLIIVFSVLGISCSGETDAASGATWEDREAEQPALAVELLEVSKGRLIPYVEAAGVISGIREAWVISETQGIIEEVNFRIGDSLNKGDVLLQVGSDIARFNMEQAKQQHETALLDLRALETFFEQGNVSRAELNRARSAASGARAAYESALKAYEDTRLKAPITGAVAWKSDSAALGNYLSPAVQVARLVDLERLKVELSLGERQIGLIREGAEAELMLNTACSGGAVPGTVAAVSAGSDLATGSYSVIVESENPCNGTILAGMSVRVRILVREEEPVVLVPASAIVVREGKEYVFVDNNGSAAPKEVERGRSIGNRTEILSGLSEGELIIASGLTAIKPGTRVTGTLAGKTGEVL